MCSSNQSEKQNSDYMKRNNIELIQQEGYQEIVKWYDNPFYGKEADYPYEMGIFRHNDQHDFVLKDSFKHPRAMYVLASIKDNRIGFVNDRAAELEVADLYDFVKLLIEATEKIDCND